MNDMMWDTFACATSTFLTHFIISIAVLENVPPDAGLQKRDTFSTLNVGLAGTGNRTRATCVACSGTNRSAIHYALIPLFPTMLMLLNLLIRSFRARASEKKDSEAKREEMRHANVLIAALFLFTFFIPRNNETIQSRLLIINCCNCSKEICNVHGSSLQ
jgi:hypothetical protein